MHGVMRSKLQARLSRLLRLPSIAGNGLPERMRSTAFAFLGLTAALGLALVAVFAQLSFPVLAPAPPPAGPGGEAAVSTSLALGRSASSPPGSLSGVEPAARRYGDNRVVPPVEGTADAVGEVGAPRPVAAAGGTVGSDDDESTEAPSPPPPVSTPPSNEGPVEAAPASTPAPAPIPTPDPGPVTSTTDPSPGKKHEKPDKPDKPAKPAKPEKPESKPEKPDKLGEKPGDHEQEGGEEPPVVPPPPAPETPPGKDKGGKDKGKAFGHYR